MLTTDVTVTNPYDYRVQIHTFTVGGILAGALGGAVGASVEEVIEQATEKEEEPEGGDE